MYTMKIVRVELAGLKFPLVFNIAASLRWNDDPLHETPVDRTHPEATARIAHIMAEEAAAVQRYMGYDPSPVPTEEELLEYFSRRALLWELGEVFWAIDEAIKISNNRDYLPEENREHLIDSIELKKD